MELYSSKGSIPYHQPRILYSAKLSFKSKETKPQANENRGKMICHKFISSQRKEENRKKNK